MKLEQWIAKKKNEPAFREAAAENAFAQDVADLVVRLRVEAGLSQAELARRAGTTQPAISRLECGVGNPTLAKVARIVDVLSRLRGDSRIVLTFTVHAPIEDKLMVGAVTASAPVPTHTGEWAVPTMDQPTQVPGEQGHSRDWFVKPNELLQLSA